MRFSGSSIDLLTCGSYVPVSLKFTQRQKALGTVKNKGGSCMEWKGCACRKGKESCVPWFCNFRNPLHCFNSCQEGKTKSVNGCMQKKVSLQKGLARAFSRLRTLDGQVPVWTVLKGSLSEPNPFNLGQRGLQRQRRGPDGEVSCLTCISWGFRELQLIGIHQVGPVQGDLLRLCQCVPSGPKCLVVYAAFQGNSLACLKRKSIVSGPGFRPGDFF